jgi:hypothetical protein
MLERILTIICYLLTGAVIIAMFYAFMHIPDKAQIIQMIQQWNQ